MNESPVDVFGFTTLRSPAEINTPLSRRVLVQDDLLVAASHPTGSTDDFTPRLAAAFAVATPGLSPVEIFSATSVSPIARLAVSAVRNELTSASNASTNARQRNTRILSQLTPQLLQALAQGLAYGASVTPSRTAPVVRAMPVNSTLSPQDGAVLTGSTAATTFTLGNLIYRVPSTIDGLPLPLGKGLANLYEALSEWVDKDSLGKTEASAVALLQGAARRAMGLNSDQKLIDQVLSADGSGHYGHFLFSKRVAFDCYYALYLLRRTLPVSPAPALAAIRALNLLEQLAIQEFLLDLDVNTSIGATQLKRLELLRAAYPQLLKWKPSASLGVQGLSDVDAPGLRTPAHLLQAIGAAAVVHPFFARLAGYFVPFNEIKPIGLGDMKVVRQKFRGYEKSEIAHIETVLSGEKKTRTHRRLDKSESSFSFNSSTDSSFSRDSQSTSRFEVKAEADRAIQLTLGANVDSRFNFKGGPVLESASLGVGLSLNSSDNRTERASQTFAQEVVKKATENIQTKVSTQRTMNVTSENEETNVHKFLNTPENDHISGMYMWLDKVYEGQVYSLGQRLMFEFVVPEPAAFYVDMRLQAYARKLQLPRKPVKTNVSTSGPTLPVASPSAITEEVFRDLTAKYELNRFKYPEASISKLVMNPTPQGVSASPGPNFLMQRPVAWGDTAPLRDEAFSGDLGEVPPGYAISAFNVSGTATFININESNENEINTLEVFANNQKVFARVDEGNANWTSVGSGPGLVGINVAALNIAAVSPLPIRVATKTCSGHILNFRVTLTRTAQGLLSWQQQVYDEIRRQETAKSGGGSAAQDYETKMAQYNDAIDKLSAVELNDIIRGASPRANEAVIRTELKRQCLGEIAREFDADSSDDVVSRIDAVGSVSLGNAIYRRLSVKTGGTPAIEYGEFADVADPAGTRYVADNLTLSRRKARFIQFLEQAFDWGQMSYLFYPYFWAAMPRWIEMLDREDESDPMFTEFLRAGSARILLSVKPGYEDAALHFVATGEPWEGGSPPVIGDPTFIPLYEEVRASQTRDAAGTPVGDSWIFRVPTSLIYLESSTYPLVNPYVPPSVPPPAPPPGP